MAERGGAIVDATFHRAATRGAFADALGGAPAPVWLACTAPPDVLRARVQARAEGAERVSDATPGVLEAQLAAWEPPDGAVELDTTDDLDAVLRDVRAALDLRLAGERDP